MVASEDFIREGLKGEGPGLVEADGRTRSFGGRRAKAETRTELHLAVELNQAWDPRHRNRSPSPKRAEREAMRGRVAQASVLVFVTHSGEPLDAVAELDDKHLFIFFSFAFSTLPSPGQQPHSHIGQFLT